MVSNRVSNAGYPPLRVPPHPIGILYMRLTQDCEMLTVNLTFLILVVDRAGCVSTMEMAVYLLHLFIAKR